MAVNKKATTPSCEENKGNTSERGKSNADNAEHVTVNKEEGANVTEIEDNAAVINNLTGTAVNATTNLFANLDIDDNSEMEHVDSNKCNDNFSLPGIQRKYPNTRERTVRQEHGHALKCHPCRAFVFDRGSDVGAALQYADQQPLN